MATVPNLPMSGTQLHGVLSELAAETAFGAQAEGEIKQRVTALEEAPAPTPYDDTE